MFIQVLNAVSTFHRIEIAEVLPMNSTHVSTPQVPAAQDVTALPADHWAAVATSSALSRFPTLSGMPWF
jgi:hypothetical protein